MIATESAADAAAGPAAAGATPTSTPTVRRSARRALFWIIAGLAALLVAVIVFLLRGFDATGGTPFSATGSGQSGSMALVEVLRDQGVDVRVADSLDGALAELDDSSTLFVADTGGFLAPEQLDRLEGAAARIVVAEPDFSMLRALAPGVGFGGVPASGTADAGCDIPEAERAGTITTGTRSLSAGAGWTGCFASGEAFALVRGVEGGTTTSLLADGIVLQNATITENGNAALALGLLGAEPRLVWYLPTLADVVATGEPTLGELTPTWVTPVLVLLAVVFLAAAVWRGRRFGALVAENLPVIVPASETMEGRARLYARTASRARAADALRIGTIDRMSRRLGLPASATVDEVSGAAAARTGMHVDAVRGLLVGRHPTGDRDLVALSDQLLDLEERVQRALDPTTSQPPRDNQTPTERVDQ